MTGFFNTHPKRELVFSPKKWTYGAEHEFGDWDKRKGLPNGFIVDRKDVTVMNSNGIAADPKGKSYPYGGEINTPPTSTPEGQVEALKTIKKMHPDVAINHRSNLHIHIRVPGLKTNLNALKIIAHYNFKNLKAILNLIEYIPRPTKKGYPITEQYKGYPITEQYTGAIRRYNRRKASHHTIVTQQRVEMQMQAKTVEAFFKAEVPCDKNGRPLWYLGTRAAINLRQLRETDTIEFRHFPGTLDDEELLTCVEWCRDYLDAALNTGELAINIYEKLYHWRVFPLFPTYIHWMEVCYRATCHDGKLKRAEIEKNIKAIAILKRTLNGVFEE